MKAQSKFRRAVWLSMLSSLFVSSLILHPSSLRAQGALTPPGAPGPTMKTLDQVEPRRPIKNSDLPLTITNAATNFYLTENIFADVDVSVPGITINANSVTIDLNGFILGGNGLNGIVCSPGVGNITVCNGYVQGWTGSGIDLSPGSNCRVVGVTAWSTGSVGNAGTAGISVGNSSTVINCISRGNLQDGIDAGSFCVVSQCTASGNAAIGIFVGSSSGIDRSIASNNMSRGFYAFSHCSISYCTAEANGDVGILATGNCSYVGCTATGNMSVGLYGESGSTFFGCTSDHNSSSGISLSSDGAVTSCSVSGNGFDGIEVGTGCMITGCSADDNAGDGLRTDTGCRVTNNVSFSNDGRGFFVLNAGTSMESNSASLNLMGGFVIGGSNNFVAKNLAHGNSVANFSVAANQRIGTIITGTGTIPSDPWANFEF